MQFLKLLIITILFLFTIISNLSAEVNQHNVRQFNLLVEKLKQHPFLLQEEQKEKFYKYLMKKSGGIPNPKLVLGLENIPINNPKFNQYLPSSKTFGFEQDIPAFGIRNNKVKLNLNQIEEAKLSKKLILLNLKFRLISALVDIQKVKKLQKLAQKKKQFLKIKEEFLRGGIEGGKKTYSKLSEVDLDNTDIEKYLNNLTFEEEKLKAELINLVGEVPTINHLENITLNYQKNNLENLLPLLIINQQIKTKSQNVRIKKNQFLPDLTVSALYKIREGGSDFKGDDWFSVQLKLGIPLWLAYNQLPDFRAAKADKTKIMLYYQAQSKNWQQKLDNLFSEIKNIERNIKLLQTKEGSFNQLIATIEGNYESSISSYEDVLNTKIDKISILQELVEYKARNKKLIAEYNSYYNNYIKE